MTAVPRSVPSPGSDEPGATAVEDTRWHRLSPRMLLIHPVLEVRRALPALAGIFLAGSTHGHHYWGLASTGIVILLSLTRWFTTRLRVSADHVQLRHGLLRRRTVTTARNRIRTVDVTSHVLHRALGLARVVVGTGTNDHKHGGTLTLDGLTLATARTLRDDLLHRVELTKTDDAAAESRELARLRPRWIGYAPFTLSGVFTGLVIWGLYWRVQGESGIDLSTIGPIRAVADWLGRLPTAGAVLVVVGAIAAFVAVTSTVGYVLAFWNFRLVRNDGGTLQVIRGLLTTRATSIERRRLVGVQLSEPLPLRAVGAMRTVVVATGLRVHGGAERSGQVLLPPAPREEALRVASVALDDTPAVTARLRPHPRAARERRLARSLLGAVVVAAAAAVAWAVGAPSWVLLLGVIALVGAVPLGLDRYRSLGHALVDGRLVTSHGTLDRKRSVLDTDAVIGWTVRTTFFQRRLGLASLVATTAAGRQGYWVDDLAADDAVALAAAVTPGLVDQFRIDRHRAVSPPALPATSR